MNPSEFIAKWDKAELTERSAAQQHFLDLCDLVGHPKAAALDQFGDTFTFERGASKLALNLARAAAQGATADKGLLDSADDDDE